MKKKKTLQDKALLALKEAVKGVVKNIKQVVVRLPSGNTAKYGEFLLNRSNKN